MTKKKFIFVSCAFDDERYIEQQDRLKKSILDQMPDANIMFNRGGVPDGSLTMEHSLYGFKVHAINNQWNDYDYIIWLDPAMIYVKDIEALFDITDANEGVYAVRDDTKLSSAISDLAIEYYGTTRETIKSLNFNLVGGSLYVFNTNIPKAKEVFRDWYKAELMGVFGTQAQAQSERINSHRNDESCMAMAMYSNQVAPIPPDVARYNTTDSIFIKKHFK